MAKVHSFQDKGNNHELVIIDGIIEPFTKTLWVNEHLSNDKLVVWCFFVIESFFYISFSLICS